MPEPFGTVLTDRRDGGRLKGDVVVGGTVGLVPSGPGLLGTLGAVLDAIALLDLADPVIRPRTHDLGVGPASGGLRERRGKDSRVCIERDDGRFVYVRTYYYTTLLLRTRSMLRILYLY